MTYTLVCGSYRDSAHSELFYHLLCREYADNDNRNQTMFSFGIASCIVQGGKVEEGTKDKQH